jgi:hypothetical protein
MEQQSVQEKDSIVDHGKQVEQANHKFISSRVSDHLANA